MPLVTVILPNYNHAVFLVKRIQSILSQTWQDFELIILDDCSTDNSKAVIETYRSHDKVSHIVYNQVNSGSTFNQWDKGISLAAGEFIWIAESDDYCEPSFLAALMPPLQNDPALAIAFCQTLFVTPDEKIISKTEAQYLARKISGQEFLKKDMLGLNAIANVSMAVFRKTIVLSVSPDYKAYKYCGDWLFYASMCLQGNVFISGRYLNYYLRHERSVTSSTSKKGFDFIEGNSVFHFIKKNVPVDEEDIRHALHKKIDRYVQLRQEFSSGVKKEVIKSLYGLDPSMRRLFKKRMALLYMQGIFSAMKRKIAATLHAV